MDELGLYSEWVVSEIWGEASYREMRLTLAERGGNGWFEINDDDDFGILLFQTVFYR